MTTAWKIPIKPDVYTINCVKNNRHLGSYHREHLISEQATYVNQWLSCCRQDGVDRFVSFNNSFFTYSSLFIVEINGIITNEGMFLISVHTVVIEDIALEKHI